MKDHITRIWHKRLAPIVGDLSLGEEAMTPENLVKWGKSLAQTLEEARNEYRAAKFSGDDRRPSRTENREPESSSNDHAPIEPEMVARPGKRKAPRKK